MFFMISDGRRFVVALFLAAAVVVGSFLGIVMFRAGEKGKEAVTASTGSNRVTIADSTDIIGGEPTESTYPGGETAWRLYLKRSLHYPPIAVEREIEGVVVVMFAIDRDGRVGNVQAVSGPDSGGLRQEAIRVIANSGKWVPSMDGGRHLKTYQRQPIVFKFAD